MFGRSGNRFKQVKIETPLKTEIRKWVTVLYYQMLVLQEKKQMLLQQKQPLYCFLPKTGTAFKTRMPEYSKKTAGRISINAGMRQLNLLQEDYNVLQTQFGALLNTAVLYQPEKINICFTGKPGIVAAAYPLLKIKKRNKRLQQKVIT